MKRPPLDLSSRYLNLGLLVAGFALGQGALFAAQTWLLISGKSGFLGHTGLAYTVAVFAIYLADFGGLIVLARHKVVADPGGHTISRLFWGFTSVRLAVAVCIVASAFAYMAAAPVDGFASGYALAAAPAVFLFAVNPGGLLDGSERSGWSGLTSSLPALTTAAILCPASLCEMRQAGLLLGGAFSIGTLLAVASQYVLLHHFRIRLGPPQISANAVAESFREGGLYILTWAPGQLLYRGQLALAGAILGPTALGLLVYAKQSINAGSQLLQFTRRVEFPRLIAAIQNNSISLISLMISRQRITLVVTSILCLGILGFGSVLAIASPHHGRESGLLLLAFVPVLFSTSLYQAVQQINLAAGRYRATAAVTLPYAAVTLTFSWFFARSAGIYAFPIAEFAAQVAATTVLVFTLHINSKTTREVDAVVPV